MKNTLTMPVSNNRGQIIGSLTEDVTKSFEVEGEKFYEGKMEIEIVRLHCVRASISIPCRIYYDNSWHVVQRAFALFSGGSMLWQAGRYTSRCMRILMCGQHFR